MNTAQVLQMDAPYKGRQLDRVYTIMWFGCWRSLARIADIIQARFGVMDSEAAISARLRDLRKEGYAVECRRVGKGRSQREYRVTRTTDAT